MTTKWVYNQFVNINVLMVVFRNISIVNGLWLYNHVIAAIPMFQNKTQKDILIITNQQLVIT